MLKGFLRESSYGFVEYNAFPRSSDPIYIVSYYLKWVTTSWTYSMYPCDLININIKMTISNRKLFRDAGTQTEPTHSFKVRI